MRFLSKDVCFKSRSDHEKPLKCNFQHLNILRKCIITPPSGRGLVIPIFFPWCFLFLVVTCPRPPVFARPNKYSSCLSLHRQGLLSWVTVTSFTPPGGKQRRGLMPLGLFTPPSGRGLVIPIFFPWFFFWWSLAPDLREQRRGLMPLGLFLFTFARGLPG